MVWNRRISTGRLAKNLFTVGREQPVAPAKYSCVQPLSLNATSAFSSPCFDTRHDLPIVKLLQLLH
ncbi:hypothetical protein [Nostoc sp. C110]|uniref:hypothetical protein n=1 Tax=Nostoc sp. C110 TaxID=3349876 RepID=UPI00370D9304